MRTIAAAAAGVIEPASSPSSATVASAAAREKRVGGRNSRTSSQERAVVTSPARAADRAREAGAQRSRGSAPRPGGKRRLVTAGGRGSRPVQRARATGSRAPDQERVDARARPERAPARLGRPEHQLRLGIRERGRAWTPPSRAPESDAAAPAASTRLAAAARSRQRPHYWTILTFNRAAACET